MKAKLVIAIVGAAIGIGVTAEAQAQNWMYSHGPGGTPPAMYNTPYAPQNQQWGYQGYTQPQQPQQYYYQPQQQGTPCVAMPGVSSNPACR